MGKKHAHRHSETWCEQPDREVPELVCGHPLPCPWHTVTIDLADVPPSIRVPITNPRAVNRKLLRTLKEIGHAILEESPDA